MNKAGHNGAGATPRRQYDETYKRHAVELTLRGDRAVKAVAEDPPYQSIPFKRAFRTRRDSLC
jgi:transposase-like protein